MKIHENRIREILQKQQIPFKEISSTDKDIEKIIKMESCIRGHKDSGKLLFFRDGHVQYKCHHDSCSKDNIITFLKQYAPDQLESGKAYTGNKGERAARPDKTAILSSVKKFNEVEEAEISWLLPGYLPQGEINILCAEGGSGKGFLAAALISGITRGVMPEFLQSDFPFKMNPGTVFYLTSEDDAQKVLKKRLRNAGADLDRIRFIDRTDPVLQEISFSDENGTLDILLNEFRPDLVIFDPVQSFLPEKVRMGERNHMRRCINHLSVLSGEYGTTFLLFCHTNKREVADPRKALADSADLWDIARSIMFTGNTAEGDLKYFSQEKSNYSRLIDKTILYRIGASGAVEYSATTNKKFRDFAAESQKSNSSTSEPSAKKAAMLFIVQTLKAQPGHELPVKELNELCEIADISKSTRQRAKNELTASKVIAIRQEGYGDNKRWFIRLLNDRPIWNSDMDDEEEEEEFS